LEKGLVGGGVDLQKVIVIGVLGKNIQPFLGWWNLMDFQSS